MPGKPPATQLAGFPPSLALTEPAGGANIKLMSANGAKLILTALVPEFERQTRHKITIDYHEAGVLREHIIGGEVFDLVVLPGGWDQIRTKIDGAPVAIGHTEFGMAFPASAPVQDMTSSEALKRALMAVKSIVYTDPQSGGIGGVLFAHVIERLGIVDAVNKKSRLVAGVVNATFVANGEADLAVQLGAEIRAVPGVRFVPMPPEFQSSITFSGAVAAGTREAGAARALIRALTAPEAAPVIRSKGFEPG